MPPRTTGRLAQGVGSDARVVTALPRYTSAAAAAQADSLPVVPEHWACSPTVCVGGQPDLAGVHHGCNYLSWTERHESRLTIACQLCALLRVRVVGVGHCSTMCETEGTTQVHMYM